MSAADGLNSQLSGGVSDQLGGNDLVSNDGICLPPELIQRILCFANEKTVLDCRFVCKDWNEIIIDYVLRRKAEIKMGCKFTSNSALGWKDFYLICTKNLFNRNLLKNHSGAEGFKYWKMIDYDEDDDEDDDDEDGDEDEGDDGEFDGDYVDWDSDTENEQENDNENQNENRIEARNENEIVDDIEFNENEREENDNESDNEHENRMEVVEIIESGDESPSDIDDDDEMHHNGWIVECPPIGVPPLPEKPEFENKEHCFVTTHYDCFKEYTIDLLKEGFSENILDNIQPPIEINEWYSSRWDCAAIYKLRVFLLNKSGVLVNSFEFDDILQGNRQNVWLNAKHEFKKYGAGLRKIKFIHGGRDRQYWAGHYGSKMAGAYVKVKIPDELKN